MLINLLKRKQRKLAANLHTPKDRLREITEAILGDVVRVEVEITCHANGSLSFQGRAVGKDGKMLWDMPLSHDRFALASGDSVTIQIETPMEVRVVT